MTELDSTASIVLQRIYREVADDKLTLRLELTSGDDVCNIRLRRSRNPILFDFIVQHIAVIPTEVHHD